MELQYLIMINSAPGYIDRRHAIRHSWLQYLNTQLNVAARFVVGTPSNTDIMTKLNEEQQLNDDIVLVNVKDSYATLLQKMTAFIRWALERYTFRYFMHVDDDSFVRVDLLTQLSLPINKLYWGYMWNLTQESSHTKPIRDDQNKSYMPEAEYPINEYPAFASGCGFILSLDIIKWINKNTDWLKMYRIIDAGIGIWVQILQDITYIHSNQVSPYRPIPLFRSDTIVQHYMRPEEFAPYYHVST